MSVLYLKCIDRVPRLGFFSGSLEQIKTSIDIPYGITGLLCADDTRLSYYLDEEKNNIVNNNGKYFDYENELALIKTIPRLDSHDFPDDEFTNNVKLNKYVEVFAHLSLGGILADSGKRRLVAACEYAKENNYHFGFLTDIFN